MFSFISMNCRGQPLRSLEVIVNLIAGTTTTAGLRIQAALDKNLYKKGISVPDDVVAAVQITPAKFHAE